MKRLYHMGLCVLLFTVLTSCNGQTKSNNQIQPNSSTTKNKLVGGGCDGCEIMFVGMPTNINSVDTSVGWTEKGQKTICDINYSNRTYFFNYWQPENT